jgi:hypothetical protein
MMEGGWSFNKELDDEASTNWSSGNVIHTLIMATAIYSIFIISSKSRLLPNIIFFILVFTIYMINTQRTYLLERKQITDKTSDSIVKIEAVLMIFALIVLFIGLIDYIVYQQDNYGDQFSWLLFFIGSQSCSYLEK